MQDPASGDERRRWGTAVLAQDGEVTPYHPFCLAGGRWRRLGPAFWACGASVLGVPLVVVISRLGPQEVVRRVLVGCVGVQALIALLVVPAMVGIRFAAARRFGHLDAIVLTRLTPHGAARVLERGAMAGFSLCALLLVPLALGSSLLAREVLSYGALLVYLAVGAEAGSHQAAVVGALGWTSGLPRVWPLSFLWVWGIVLGATAGWDIAYSQLGPGWSLILAILAVGPAAVCERLGVDMLDETLSRWPPDPLALRWWERPFAYARIARRVELARHRLLRLARSRAAAVGDERRLDPAEVNRSLIEIIGPETAQKLLPGLWSDIEAVSYEVGRGQAAMAELAVKHLCATLEKSWHGLVA